MKSVSASFLFPRHCRIAISGASNTGKSVLLQKLIEFNGHVFERGVDHLIVFYLMDNPLEFARLAEHVSVEFHQGLGKLEEVVSRSKQFFTEKKVMIVLEDLQYEVYNSEVACKLFTCYTHHLPLEATVFVAQSLYQKSQYQSLINRNLTHICFTKSKRLKSILPFLARELLPHNPKLLRNVFEEAIHPKHGRYPYLIANLDAEDDGSMFYSGILPSESLRVFQEDGDEPRAV